MASKPVTPVKPVTSIKPLSKTETKPTQATKTVSTPMNSISQSVQNVVKSVIDSIKNVSTPAQNTAQAVVQKPITQPTTIQTSIPALDATQKKDVVSSVLSNQPPKPVNNNKEYSNVVKDIMKQDAQLVTQPQVAPIVPLNPSLRPVQQENKVQSVIDEIMKQDNKLMNPIAETPSTQPVSFAMKQPEVSPVLNFATKPEQQKEVSLEQKRMDLMNQPFSYDNYLSFVNSLQDGESLTDNEKEYAKQSNAQIMNNLDLINMEVKRAENKINSLKSMNLDTVKQESYLKQLLAKKDEMEKQSQSNVNVVQDNQMTTVTQPTTAKAISTDSINKANRAELIKKPFSYDNYLLFTNSIQDGESLTDEEKEYARQANLQIMNNVDLMDRELKRTTDKINDRAAKGLDTTKQLTYYKQLVNQKNSLSKQNQLTNPVNNAQESKRDNVATKQDNTAMKQENKTFEYDPNNDPLLKSILSIQPFEDKNTRAEFKPESFNYDPNVDSVYQEVLKNALSNAELNSKRASKDVLEMMNERGLLNSSLTSNQLAEIANQYLQQANSDIQMNLLPQLMQQAYNRYRDSVSDQQFNVSRQDQINNQDYQRYLDALDMRQKQAQLALNSRNQQFGEYQSGLEQDARNRQLAMQEAGLTGNYEGKQTLESILANRDYNLKRGQLLGSIDGVKTFDAKNADRNYELDVSQQKISKENADRSYKLDERKQKLAEQTLADEKKRNAALDTEEKKRWWANYERQGQQWAKDNQINWAKLNQAQKEFASDQAWKQKNYDLNVRQQNWAESTKNPLNQQRLENAQSNNPKPEDVFKMEANEMVKSLRENDKSPEEALKEIDLDLQLKIYTNEEAQQLKEIIYKMYPELNPKEIERKSKSIQRMQPPADFANPDAVEQWINQKF